MHDIRSSYKLTTDDIAKYMTSIRVLSAYTKIWPNVEELIKCANKVELSANLDAVASETTNTPRPKLHLVTSIADSAGRRKYHIPDQFPEYFVIKRTHSEVGAHVLLPDIEDGIKKVKVHQPIDIPDAQWFMQSWAHFIREAGEIRMFFVGMTHVYSVHTVKKPGDSDLTFVYVETVAPLDILQ